MPKRLTLFASVLARQPGKLTLTYDGGFSGTLTIKAPFGEMRLPTTKEEREDRPLVTLA